MLTTSYLLNVVTVDPSSLGTSKAGSLQWLTLSDPKSDTTRVAVLVSVGMVSTSTLHDNVACMDQCKYVDLLLPSLFLDRLQTCLCIAFDKWDGHLCSEISGHGVRFGTEGEYSILFPFSVFYVLLIMCD